MTPDYSQYIVYFLVRNHSKFPLLAKVIYSNIEFYCENPFQIFYSDEGVLRLHTYETNDTMENLKEACVISVGKIWLSVKMKRSSNVELDLSKPKRNDSGKFNSVYTPESLPSCNSKSS